ncbi:hypothetical protein FRB94_011852 [Tulasnella sp. JGI-2019a]|nr:hypothetical protein FRB94_011852 [Tulasnella sp. JGI-2019a]
MMLNVSQLLGILHESRRLVTLNVSHNAVDSLRSQEHAHFNLPRLTTLSFLLIPIDTAYDIMTSVRIPNCAALTIKCIQGKQLRTAGFFGSETAHLGTSIRSILAVLPRIQLSLTSLAVFCSGMGKDAELGIHLPILPMLKKPSSVGWLEKIHSSLASPPDIELNITGSEGANKRPPMLKKSSPFVTVLNIYGSPSEAHRWMKHLGTPTIIDGVFKRQLPNLRVLKFDVEGLKGKDLLNMVRTRYGGG